MNPYRVTITGADDRVDPLDLIHLSCEFPFVEWALLHSTKRDGSERYPTEWWRNKFFRRCAERSARVRTALHVCGSVARQVSQGGLPILLEGQAMNLGAFDRVQINGFVPPPSRDLHRLAMRCEITFILQCRAEDTLQETARAAEMLPGASVLFDPSGGRGIESFRYPPTPLGCRLGFAGGIGPDNVLDVIRDIGPRDPYWIDMESGVRTDDKLDLAKVRRVLEQIATLTVAPGKGEE